MKTTSKTFSPPGESRQGRRQHNRWLWLLMAFYLMSSTLPSWAGLSEGAQPRAFSSDMNITPDDPYMTFEVSHLNYDGNNFHWRTFELVVDGVNIGSIANIGCNVSCGWKNDEGKWGGHSGWMGGYFVSCVDNGQGNDKYKYTFIKVYFPTNAYGQVHTLEVNGIWVSKNGSTLSYYGPNQSRHIKYTSNAVTFNVPNGSGSFERTVANQITWTPSNSVTTASGYSHRYKFKPNGVGNWTVNSDPNRSFILTAMSNPDQIAFETQYETYRYVTLNGSSQLVCFYRKWDKTVSSNIVKGCVSPRDIDASFDQWNKTVTVTWKKTDAGRLTNGKFYVFRYANGDATTREKLEVVEYNANLRFVDSNIDYDQNYTYEVSSILDNWSNDAPVADLTQTVGNISTIPVYNFPTFTDTRRENSVYLSWTHDKLNTSASVSFKVWRCQDTNSFYDEDGHPDSKKIIANMGDPYATVKASSTGTTTSFEDKQIASSCTTYWYLVGVDLFGRTFYSSLLGPTSIEGSTSIKSLTANRGTYSDVIKLQWDVTQIGTDPSRFVVSRRLLGSQNDNDYQNVWVTSGTESSYFFSDTEVESGKFYQYRVMAQSNCVDNVTGETTFKVTDRKEVDGFCQSRGIISGRITYGTGTAVPNAKVLLTKNKESNDDADQFYSMQVEPQGGIVWSPTASTGEQLFQGKPFTFQLYVRPDKVVSGGSTIIDGGGLFALQLKPTQADSLSELCLQVNGNDAVPTGIMLKDSVFTNVSLTCNGGKGWTVRAVEANTITTYAYTAADSLKWTGDSLTFGSDKLFTVDHAFTGYLDDIRLWSKVLTDQEILGNYDRLLIGTEAGLKLYWPMDEGVAALPFTYDYSKSSGVANENHGHRAPNTIFATVIPTADQLRLYGKTDEEGNYVIRGIPFSGEGTNYSVRPTLGIHAFTPQYQTRFVNKEALTHSAVDFDDVSSFPVSGTVYYEHTDYPVEGVNFYVDGTICSKDGKPATTDAQGRYTISVPIGDHYITVGKQGHTFVYDGRYPVDTLGVGQRFTFDREVTDLVFYDNTLVTVAGRVVGGDTEAGKPLGMGESTNNIGQARVTLSLQSDSPYRLNVVETHNVTTYSIDPNANQLNVASPTVDVQSTAWRTGGTHNTDVKSIIIETDPKTGEFAAQVPPLLYKVTSVRMLNGDAEASFAGVTFSDIDATNPLVEYTDTSEMNNDLYHKEFTYNARLAQSESTYHCTPTFMVWQDGRDDGLFGDDTATYFDPLTEEEENVPAIENGAYLFGYPLFEQSKDYTFKIKGYEQYTNSDDADNVVTTTVPLKNTLVTIDNQMSADRRVAAEEGTLDGRNYRPGDVIDNDALEQFMDVADNQLRLDDYGEAAYTWTAGMPNIYDDLTRSVAINYEYNNRNNAWKDDTFKGIILGALPSGSNFVTAGPDKVVMILRDPAGSGSSASWQKGSSHSTVNTNTVTTTSDDMVNTLSHLGAETDVASGAIAMYVIQKMEAKQDVEVGLEMNYSYEGTHTTTTTVTTTKTISTSDSPDFVGADGDVFIGTSTNLLFGNARQVLVKKALDGTYSIGSEDGLMTSTQFATEFSYTQHYIENTLIPNLEKLRNDLIKPVSASEYETWKNTTDEMKYITTLSEDDKRFGSDNGDVTVWGSLAKEGTFVAGPSYRAVKPSTETAAVYQDMVHYYNESIRNWKEQLALNEKQKLQVMDDRMSWLINNYSFDGGTSVEYSTGTEEVKDSVWSNSWSVHLVAGGKSGVTVNKTGVEVTYQTKTGSGMTYVDEEHQTESKSFTFTLKEEGDDALSVDAFNSPQKFAPIFITRGGQTSCPYEGETVTKYFRPGTSIGTATMKMEDPQLSVLDAKNVLSDVPRGGKAIFYLQLKNQSETNSDGQFNLVPIEGTNPNGALLSLSTGPLGNGHTFIVKSGETLTIPLTLEQMNTDIYDYENIGLSLQSACQSDLESTVYLTAHFVPSSSDIALTADKSVLNTIVGDVLNLKVRDYDAEFENLKYIRVQYKALGDATWSTIPGQEYYVDAQWAATNNQPLPAGGVINVEFPMENYVDGTYQFRAQTATAYGNEEITKESETITIVKDMKKPQLFGNANPSDGVLNAGDEISVTFNEDIRQSMLTETANFMITAALNGQQIAHSVALDGQATACAAKTDASINLAKKDFTTDLWLNYTGAGTLLSHGNGEEKLEVGTDAQGHLVVTIGNHTYTSAKTISQNKWVFLTLNYQYTGNGGVLNALFVADDSQTSLFTDLPVATYEGNGTLTVGKQLTGAIHELTLWDKARNCADAQAEMYYTKKPSTPNLIGYWKFDEGEGLVATDYARNRHMTLAGQTWYVNNANKAVTLNGSQAVRLNISECSALATDDYALELWFKSQQTGKAALFSTGYTAQAIEMGFDDDGALTLTSNGNTRVVATNDYRDNAWHHLALNVRRNGNAAVYVDGTPVATMSASAIGTLAGSEVVVGASKAGTGSYTDYFKGAIDEVRFWKATLTGDYLKRHKSTRLTGEEGGLVAYYPFEHKVLEQHQVVTVASATDEAKGKFDATPTSGTISYSDEAPQLKEAPTVTNIGFNFVANERTIVINLTNKAEELEGTTLDLTVRAVLDANGNESEDIHWTAYVRQNSLLWKGDNEVTVEKMAGETATFEATIINESGDSENWTLSGMPSWLTASATSGTLKAQLQKVITFTVAESTPPGRYEQTVYLTGNNNISEPLTLYLKVKSEEPTWAVNAGDYEETMNVIGALQVLGVPSQDEDDLVAAFIGGECRGVARPEYKSRYDGYFIMMDVYGEVADNEQPVTFKVFDASTGTVYPVVTTSQPVSFSTNAIVGRYDSPLVLNATDMIEQNIDLAKGWNWMSLSVRPDEMTVPVVFANAGGKVRSVKGNSMSAYYDEGLWISGNNAMTTTDMYAVNTSEALTLSVTGHRVKTAETPLTVVNGWNWVGFNSQQVMSVADALAGMAPQNGDVIKGHRGMAYFDSYEWIGSLRTLMPGQGYKIQSVATAQRTFSYPETVAAARPYRTAEHPAATPGVFEPTDYTNYASNMVLIAQVVAGGQPAAGIELGIFAGEECREAAMTDDHGMVFITIPGDSPCTLTFQVSDGTDVVEANGSIVYENDAIMGTPKAPYVIDLGVSTAIGSIAAAQDGSEWFDLQGRKVRRDDQSRKLRKGIYIVRPAGGKNGQKKVR